MSKEYGYLGSLGVDSINRVPDKNDSGEPIFSPAFENAWAKELQADDGAWRFLKGGTASGRGKAGSETAFDAMLADNFTVVSLLRLRKCTSYPLFIYKSANSAGVSGWRIRSRPVSSSGTGVYFSDSVANQETAFPSAGKATKDENWHWVATSVSGTAVRNYIDAQVSAATRTATDMTNTSNFVSGGTDAQIAAVLIYNRVLSDTEVSNIMLGKTLPKSVEGLRGYYKFNEQKANNEQCRDYSGYENHLTYSSPVFETYKPGNICYNGDFALGVTGWDGITANTGVVGGRGRVFTTGAYEGLTTSVAYTPVIKGGSYRVEFDLEIVSGQCGVSIGGSAQINFASSGRQTVVGTVTNSGTLNVEFKRVTAVQTEFYIDNVVITDLSGQSGQPYVSRQQVNPLNWWERRVPAYLDADRQGSVVSNSALNSVPHNVVLGLTGSLTVCGWINPSVSADRNWYLFDKNSSSPSYFSAPFSCNYSESSSNARLNMVRGSSAGNTAVTITLSRPLPRNKWSFITLTDSTEANGSGTVSAYVNGLLVGTGTRGATTIADSGNPLYIACNTSTRKQAARSIRLFNRALSAAEINTLYLTDVCTDRTGLVGEWLCNDLTGTTIKNTSSAGDALNATLGSGNLKVLDSPYAMVRRKRKGWQSMFPQSAGFYAANQTNMKASLESAPVWTVSYWHKHLSTSSTDSRGVWLQNQTTQLGLMISALNGHKLAVGVKNAADEAQYITLNGVLNTNAWFLISAEMVWATKTLTLYLNGVKVASKAMGLVTNVVPSLGAEQINILRGATTSAGVRADDVRIYNRALTAQEHRGLFVDVAPRDGLVAQYTFDNQSNRGEDTSGNGLHLTASGSVSYVKEP